MLAYIFWHAPAHGFDALAYERLTAELHASLAAQPPDGFRGSATYRAGELPWLAGTPDAMEDWYLIDDWTALGVLRMAAIGAGHLTAHDHAARHTGSSTGGVYRLAEGDAPLGEATHALWVAPARAAAAANLVALLLGDGMERAHAGLWQRELALGPAPELCLLAREAPAGMGIARLPAGWTVDAQVRQLVWCSETLREQGA